MALWLGDLLGIREVMDGSAGNVVLPMRRRIRFIGGAIVADDPGNDATTINVPLGGEGGELPDIATDRLLGRDTAGTGAPEQIVVTNGLAFTGSGGIGIAADGVTDARLRDSAGLSVIGRGANTTGDPADLVASGDGQVLRRNGSTLAFGTVATLGITDGAVTNAKQANMASGTIKGRVSVGSGAPEDLTGTQATTLLTQFTRSAQGVVSPPGGSGTARFLCEDNTWGIPPGNGGVVDNGVTFPKIQDIPTDTLIGRDTAGTGDPESITVGGGIEFTGALALRRSALTGDVTASAGSSATTIAAGAVTTTKIADGNVTDAKLRNSAATSVLGRSAGTSGVPADIVATGDGQVLIRSGGVLAFGTLDATGVADGSVTMAKLADLAGLSVIGRAANTTGVPAAITAGSDGGVLRRNGATIAFGTVATAGITDAAVTFAKIQNVTTDRLIGRDTTGAGAPEELTVGGNLEFTGAGGIQRGALTGDVTAAAGSGATTIANDAVSDAKLRNSVACSVLGRATNTTGDPADIAAPANDRVLCRAGDALAFAQVTGAMVTDGTLTYAKIQSTAAASRVIGRGSAAGAGAVQELVPTGGIEVSGTNLQRSALTGDVTAAAGSASTTISNNAVTDAKLRDSAACSVLGRSANTVGDPADIASSADGEVLRRAAGVLGWGTIATAGIADGAVTYAKIQSTAAASRVLGRGSAAGAGAVEELTPSGGVEVSGTALQRSALTGDVTASAGSNATTIANNAVSNAKLRDSTACSVIGRSAATTGDPADIAAGTNDTVLCRTGDALAFTTINTAMLGAAVVTYPKIQNVTSDRILGRDTATAGGIEELTVGGGLEFTGAGGIQRSALTGAVTAAAGSNATTLAADIVGNTNLRNSAGVSVIGRSANSTGDPADIAASADNLFLGRTASALAFQRVPLAAIADQAAGTLTGRASGTGTGPPVALTAAQFRTIYREAFPAASYELLPGEWLSDQRIPLTTNYADSVYALGGIPTNYVTISATGYYEYFVQLSVSFPENVFTEQWFVVVKLGTTELGRYWGFHQIYQEGPTDQGFTICGFGGFNLASAPSADLFVYLHHSLGPSMNYLLDVSASFTIRRVG